jgi:hypothetical protein
MEIKSLGAMKKSSNENPSSMSGMVACAHDCKQNREPYIGGAAKYTPLWIQNISLRRRKEAEVSGWNSGCR